MASGSLSGITAGEAWIRFGADRKQFQRDLKVLERDFRSWGNSLTRIGRNMGLAGLGIVGALGAMVPVIAQNESAWRRFHLIFDSSSKMMISRMRQLSKETGISINELARQAVGFGAIFAELRDIAGDEAFTKVVGEVLENVANLQALGGLTPEDAMARMTSAFTSTGEAVDQLGLNLRIAEQELEAQRLGMTKAIRDMTELEKQLIKLSIMNKQFSRTGVEFAKIANTINVQLSLLWLNIKDLIIAGGWALRAVLLPTLKVLNAIVRALQPIARIMSPLLVAMGGVGGTMIGTAILASMLGFMFQGIGLLIGNIGKLMKLEQIGVVGMIMLRLVLTIVGQIWRVFASLGTVLAFLGRALMGLARFVTPLTAGLAVIAAGGVMVNRLRKASSMKEAAQTIAPWPFKRIIGMLPDFPFGGRGEARSARTQAQGLGMPRVAGSISTFGGQIGRQAQFFSGGGADAATNTGNIFQLLRNVLSGEGDSLNVTNVGGS